MRVGIFGAHRVGKTTLAKELAEKLGIEFVPSATSEVFKRFNLDPSKPIAFSERLIAQQEVLAVWERSVAGKKVFICDRTPIDFAAYMLSESNLDAVVNSKEDLLLRANGYKTLCSFSAKDNLDAIIYLQPGIPMLQEEGKGLASRYLVNVLDNVIAGLHFSGNFRSQSTKVIIVPKRTIDLEARVEYCLGHLAEHFIDR